MPLGTVAKHFFPGHTFFMSTYDLICIGAGPTGLACAIEAKRAGMRPLVIDKGCLCNSLYHYPVNMVFFTTPELLEIGDLPLTSAAEKPTRSEALKYYRKCAEHYDLDLRLGHRVERVDGADGKFSVHTRDEQGIPAQFAAKKNCGRHWLLRPSESSGHSREKICRTFRITTRSRTRSGARM